MGRFWIALSISIAVSPSLCLAAANSLSLSGKVPYRGDVTLQTNADGQMTIVQNTADTLKVAISSVNLVTVTAP